MSPRNLQYEIDLAPLVEPTGEKMSTGGNEKNTNDVNYSTGDDLKTA